VVEGHQNREIEDASSTPTLLLYSMYIIHFTVLVQNVKPKITYFAYLVLFINRPCFRTLPQRDYSPAADCGRNGH